MNDEVQKKLEAIKGDIDVALEKYEKAAKDQAIGAMEEAKKELESKLEEKFDVASADVKKLKDEYLEMKAALKKAKEDGDKNAVPQTFQRMLEKGLQKEGSLYKKFIDGQVEKGSLEVKAVGDMTSSSALTGDVIESMRIPGISEPALRKVHIRSLLPVGSMGSNRVSYVVETGSEGGPATTAEGAAKPQVDYDLAEREDAAFKIPTYVRVTEELFADLPLFSSYVSTRMIGDIMRLEDNKLIYGSGVADIEGITVRTGVIDLDNNPFSGTIATASTGQALLAAAATMAANEIQVNGFLMNPADKYELQALLEPTGADVAYNLVYDGDFLRINGIPVITSTAVAAGDIIAGDWSGENIQMFQREGIRVEYSTEDADNFTTNKITVRAEERVALAVYRPFAFGFSTIAAIKAALAV